MDFWTKEKLVEALPSARLLGLRGGELSACGIFVTPTNAADGKICALRKENETAGLALVAYNSVVKDKFKVPAIMCTDYEAFKDLNLPVIEVDDISKSLYDMASYIRDFYKGKVVAVTGSAGKSTTTGICFEALKTYGVDGNVNKANTVFGISWNMAGYNTELPYWVNEVSLNKGMYPSARMLKPDVAVITNVAPVHLKHNENVETVAVLKSRLFTYMKEGAFAVLNADMAHFDIAYNAASVKKLKIITFGQGESASVQAFVNENSCGFKIFNRVVELSKFPFPMHILLDMAAVIGIFIALGLPIDDKLFNVFRAFRPLPGRGTIFHGNFDEDCSVLVMDESYNANPLSMKMTLQGFNNLYKDKKNKILVLGDMSEGGVDTKFQHINLADEILKINPDKIILVGEYMTFLYYELKDKLKGVYYFSGADALIENLHSFLGKENYLFVKGSHSVGLGSVVAYLVRKFKEHNIQN